MVWQFFIDVLATVSVQQMAHCSCLTDYIYVLATVSGQKMVQCFGLTVRIGDLATASWQQMMQCSGSTVCICVLATVSGQQMVHCFWVDSLYWCVSDCIRTANVALFCFDIAHWSFITQFFMSKIKQLFLWEGLTVVVMLLHHGMFVWRNVFVKGNLFLPCKLLLNYL